MRLVENSLTDYDHREDASHFITEDLTFGNVIHGEQNMNESVLAILESIQPP